MSERAQVVTGSGQCLIRACALGPASTWRLVAPRSGPALVTTCRVGTWRLRSLHLGGGFIRDQSTWPGQRAAGCPRVSCSAALRQGITRRPNAATSCSLSARAAPLLLVQRRAARVTHRPRHGQVPCPRSAPQVGGGPITSAACCVRPRWTSDLGSETSRACSLRPPRPCRVRQAVRKGLDGAPRSTWAAAGRR